MFVIVTKTLCIMKRRFHNVFFTGGGTHSYLPYCKKWWIMVIFPSGNVPFFFWHSQTFSFLKFSYHSLYSKMIDKRSFKDLRWSHLKGKLFQSNKRKRLKISFYEQYMIWYDIRIKCSECWPWTAWTDRKIPVDRYTLFQDRILHCPKYWGPAQLD